MKRLLIVVLLVLFAFPNYVKNIYVTYKAQVFEAERAAVVSEASDNVTGVDVQ